MSDPSNPRVIVIGAGPAGICAAATLVGHGLRPTVIDEAPRAGGQIYRQQPDGFVRPLTALYGFEAPKAQRLHRRFDDIRDSLDHRPATLAWNIADRCVHVVQDKVTQRLPFDALIVAAGATDRVIPFPGWTRPGIYTLGGAQIALKHQGCAIGQRVLFFGTGPLLYLVAYQYAKAGARVQAVLDTAPLRARLGALPALLTGGATFAKGVYYTAWLMAHGVHLESGITPVAAEGAASVDSFRYRSASGFERQISCDAIGFGYWLRPETQLVDLAGVEFAFDEAERLWLPKTDADGRTAVPGVYVAGDGARIRGADLAEATGELAAYAVLADSGRAVAADRIAALRRRIAAGARFRRALARAFPVPHQLARHVDDKTIVCRCECVTAGEIRDAVGRMGAREVNRVKAFMRPGMGRCQGRFCGLATAEIAADQLGVPIAELGRLRGQAPVKPLPVAAMEVG